MAHSFISSERDVIKELLTEQFGLDFEEHRYSILDSAVAGRMEDCGIYSAVAYRHRIDNDRTELSRLVDAATNNLSRFFRNPGQLHAVTEFIVPELARDRCGDRPLCDRSLRNGNNISIWVTGCATGEEPYSLAMALLDSLPDAVDFHITATDISRRALSFARAGRYSLKRALAVPETLRARYFLCEKGGLSVSDALRERVSFVEHNVLAAPIVRNADIVLCRNVLIYLASQACRLAIRRVRESIAVGGFLIIGGSETLPRASGFGAVVTPAARIYRRR